MEDASTPHECRSLIIFGFALIVLALGALLAPAAGLAASSYPDTIGTTPGLVAYWRLGEPAGTTAVSQTNTNHGTYVGNSCAHVQPGAIVDDPNGAVLLNSDNDFVSVPATQLARPRTTGRSRSRPGSSAASPARRHLRGDHQQGQDAYGLFLLQRPPRYCASPERRRDIATSNIPIVDTTTWHHVVATKTALGGEDLHRRGGPDLCRSRTSTAGRQRQSAPDRASAAPTSRLSRGSSTRSRSTATS